MSSEHTITMLYQAGAVGPGPDVGRIANSGIQASVIGTGQVSATVDIEVCSVPGNWMPFDTLTLAGTNSASSGTSMTVAWSHVRANLTAISGTGAVVDVMAAV